MRKVNSVLFLASIALLLSVPLVAYAALGVHNITTGASAEGACANCHNTSATAATRGWGIVKAGTPTTGWYTQAITPLCWTCHSSGNGVGANDVTGTAMDSSNHSYAISGIPPTPLAPKVHDNAAVVASNLPYTKGAALQCTSCHNVHNDQFRPYLMKTTMLGLCDTCHPGRNTTAVRVLNIGVGTDNVSVHPVDVAMDPGSLPVSMKTVANMDPAFKTVVAPATPWALGGKLAAGSTGNVVCQTCHAVHGKTGAVAIESLLAIDNKRADVTAASSLLCEGCHYGGAATGSVGTTAGDHPLDATQGRAFYPTGVALPAVWTQADGRLDRGAAVFRTTGVTGTPRCSSCHDAHGGLGAKSLLRSPIPTAANGEWCFSCHTATQVAPSAHHSAKGLENGQFASSIDCVSCHGAGFSGHNGFLYSYTVPASAFTTVRGRAISVDDVKTNRDSALCLYCHKDDDPLRWRANDTVMDPMPRSHGANRGSGSHYLGPDTNLVVDGKATPVAASLFVGSWASDAAAYSKYGNATGGGGVPPVINSSSTVICESCHSVRFNDGAVHPASYANSSTAGWWTNLLLKPYEDDPSGIGNGLNEYGIGSDLCLGCHNEAYPEHHPLTGDVLTAGARTGSVLATGAGSYANQTNAPLGGGGAPGTLSYPATNKLDCDSCHRPHSAASNSTIIGSSRFSRSPAYLILEVDAAGNNWSSSLCAECHGQ